MSAPNPKVRLVLTSILLLLFTTGLAAQKPPAHKRPIKAAQPAPVLPPAPPPPPPTLEQMPALAPQVKFNKGQLTIVAENSTLSDILRAVRAQTGAAIEIPPNANERVATHLGPGPARDVLAALLNGAHFNYVMVGSAAHPDSVDKLILTSKAGAAPEPAPAAPVAENNGNSEIQMDDPGTTGADIAEQPAEEAPENAATNSESPQQPNGQQQAKTPEQLLRELQQQQLLQQQQQQQPGAGPPPQGQPAPN